ncbi:flavodoxin domain-containing protein [Flavisolibacter sp. BT320]|nr:flavodoxin domain-containing protein [Flavisolibacter longurius]
MIAQAKIKLIQEMVVDLTKEEIIWLSGYLSGIAGAETKLIPGEASQPAASAAPSVQKITIAYGTETGNAKKLASNFAAKAKKKGIQPKLVSLEQYKLTDLPKEEWFFTIISTQGEGEPPAGAKKFYDYVHQNSVTLSKLNYGVLALGDTSYPLFCKAGEDVDSQLQKLGGKRIVPLQKLDTDYEEEADQWINSLLNSLSSSAATPAPVTVVPAKKTGKKTFTGTIQTKINLNGRGSQKETYHIEIAAPDVVFEPGDAIGIVPKNKPELVQKIVALSGLPEDALVPYRNETSPLHNLISQKLSLLNLSETVVKKYAEIVKQEIPATRMDFSDLLRIYPVSNSEQFLTALQVLDPISPRLYSIASSPEAHAGEVHLTLGMHRFCVNDLQRDGLCSYYLSQMAEGEEIDFYIHKNHLFKLPAEDKDLIMVGPGTGIAPFRSFVAHRDAIGASGRNWLFFGDQHFTTDFLYQTEWQSWIETGVLTKMNVAFSRDQQEKLYVQHKLWQHRQELVQWLDSGAHFYICGAKEPMSVDVEAMLVRILGDQKGITEEASIEYLAALKEDGRYLKDVY